MNREKMAWTVSVVLLALLAFQLPGSLAQRDDDYSFVRTLVDIHRRVVDNYVDPINEKKLDHGAIDGMLGTLDPFTIYIPPSEQQGFDRMLEGSFKGVGIQLAPKPDGSIEVVTPIDGSPAFKAGIEPGDIILKVNGKSVIGKRLPDVIKDIAGPLGSAVTLTVRHATGKTATITMKRKEVVVPTVKGYTRNRDNSWNYYVSDDPKIAYVRITQFTPDTYKELRATLEQTLSSGMKGLILDLRFNPGGRLDQAVAVLNMLLPKGRTIVSTRGLHRPETREVSDGKNMLPDFPIVVLINEGSASAAEIVSGSLKDNRRAAIVGVRSYGKGSVQELIPLAEKGGELKLTVAYYYLPSGRLVHRRKGSTDWGVIPQIYVPMSTSVEEKVAQEQDELEALHAPMPTTAPPTSQPATTQPLAKPLDDTQLQAAINTMMGILVFKTQPPMPKPTTRPATTTKMAA